MQKESKPDQGFPQETAQWRCCHRRYKHSRSIQTLTSVELLSHCAGSNIWLLNDTTGSSHRLIYVPMPVSTVVSFIQTLDKLCSGFPMSTQSHIKGIGCPSNCKSLLLWRRVSGVKLNRFLRVTNRVPDNRQSLGKHLSLKRKACGSVLLGLSQPHHTPDGCISHSFSSLIKFDFLTNYPGQGSLQGTALALHTCCGTVCSLTSLKTPMMTCALMVEHIRRHKCGLHIKWSVSASVGKSVLLWTWLLPAKL